ncbi:MAG: hypothetical protein C5B52_08810 [Bacteroidetes bacterium]|nr:MAG: hypothetical protein C5B52_08810 [Bacteroidota bacterium]
MSDYIVIHHSEDGDVTVVQLSEQELLSRLDTQYWGEIDILHQIPRISFDIHNWGTCLIIIRGNIVVPTPEEVVTKYKFGK